MYCENCGVKLPDDSRFCEHCGKPLTFLGSLENFNNFKIESLIPEYTGYAERDNRGQCDKLLRKKMAMMINSCEKLMSKRISTSIKLNENSQINDNEECRKKLNTIRAKVKYASYGESAFFNSAQLNDDELLIIYKKDSKLLDKVNDINITIPDLECNAILKKIDDLEKLLNERNDYIKEFK